MPLTARNFITRRTNRNAEFLTHLVPQMDYLENLFRKTIGFLNSVEPKDAQLIQQYKTMADALHTVAHSHESIFNSQSSLQNALNTLGGLPDFLEADNGANLRQLQATADENLTLLNDVPQQDKFKNVLQHVLDVNSFCELGYGMRSMNRTDSFRRERFDAKRDADYKRDEPFNRYTGRQVRLLSYLLRTAADDLRKAGGDSARIDNLEYAAKQLSEIAKRGQFYMENPEVESSLRGLQYLPGILEADGNVKLLGETLKAHSEEALGYLPMDPKEKNYQSYQEKTLPDHIQDVLVYFDLPASPDLMSDLNEEKTRVLAERKELADRRAENERLRREEEKEKQEINEINRVKAEEEQDKEEDEEELKREEDLRTQEEKRKQEQNEKYKKFHDENGAFSLPEDYDNRDVAGMFVLSAKQEGAEYNALKNFSNTLNRSINEWNEYATTEYAKRYSQVLQEMPENATAEQMSKGIDDVLASVSAEEKEKLVRAYYPLDYEQRLATERSKLPQGAEDGQALTNLYRAVVTEQYRDDLRKKTYTADQIRDARREASIELARRKLEQSSQKEKKEFNKQRDAQLNDEIARQIKSQITEGYRSQRKNFVNDWFPSDFSRDEYVKNHRNLQGLQGEELQNGLYESRMGELVDAALQNRNDWNNLNRILSTHPTTVPESLKTKERQRTPLNVALQKTRELPITKLTEKSMLLERSKTISPEEIDQLAGTKLPLPENDQQLLYRWARDHKKEQLQEQIRQDRNAKFPETAQAGIENLKEMHTQAQTILKTCRDVLPTDAEREEPPFDYESEITRDKNLSVQDRRMLREEYKKAQEELKIQRQRELHPNLPTKADEELKKQIERDAALRLGMSEDEKRKERIKILNEQNEARRRKRIFQKDWNTRLSKAREDKRRSIDEAKDKKVEGQLQAVGDAVGALRSKLFAGPLGEGALGNAYKQLDNAFTGSDLEEGKNYRVKMGIDPEKRPVVNPAPKKVAQNIINEQDYDPDLESEDSVLDVPKKEYSFVEDDRYVKVDYGKQTTELVTAKKVKEKEKKKRYLFEIEDLDAIKEEKPKIVEEEQPKEDANEHLVDHPAGQENSDANIGRDDYTQIDLVGVSPEQVVNEYKGQKTQLWNNVKNDPGLSKEDRDDRLSTVIALDVLSKKVLEDQNSSYLTPDNIEAEAEKIRSSGAYKLLFEKGKPDYLQEAAPDKMLAAYGENVKNIGLYEIPENQQNKFESRLGSVVDSLENTGSGKIIKYIPRGPWGNSTAYENALAAISTVKRNAGNLSPDELYQNTATVLKYLDKKETVRKRPFGRQRWTDCMTFLKQTMPPAQFKTYCDYVNQKRGVSDNPAHPDYVSPETFGSTDYKEACDETLDQIRRGKGRAEDYATLIALRNLNPMQPIDKKQLTLKKQEIMNDEAFKQLNLPENKAALHKFVVDEKRKDYLTLAQKQDEANMAQPLIP